MLEKFNLKFVIVMVCLDDLNKKKYGLFVNERMSLFINVKL